MAENAQIDVKKLSFERAIEELESIVKRLEDGKVPLGESVAIYERGEALKRRREAVLAQGGGAVASGCGARRKRGLKRSQRMPAASRPGPSRSMCSDRMPNVPMLSRH